MLSLLTATRAERRRPPARPQPAADGVPVYDGRCRRLPPEELARLARSRRPAWRVRVPEEVLSFRDLLQGGVSQDLSLDCGDFILRRSDGVYAYQLAVVVDDGAMGVTQVVRAAICWTPPRGSCGSRSGWACPTRSTAMCPCSWPPMAAAWPNGTGTRSWERSRAVTPPRSCGAAGPAGRIDPGVRPHLPR